MADLYSVVVLGSLNPAIHHPLWYADVGLISDDERVLALHDPNLLCTPHVSQFSVGAISVNCTSQRWEARTNDESAVDRIVNLVCAVFDTLTHTPMNAFGFNFNFGTPAPGLNAGGKLVEMIQSAELKFGGPDAKKPQARIQYSFTQLGTRYTVAVEQSPEESGEFLVSVNAHHPIRGDKNLDVPPLVEGEFQNFDLGDLIREKFPLDRSAANGIREQMLSVVS